MWASSGCDYARFSCRDLPSKAEDCTGKNSHKVFIGISFAKDELMQMIKFFFIQNKQKYLYANSRCIGKGTLTICCGFNNVTM